MCLSWVRLTQHVSVLLNPLCRNTGAYYSNSSLFFYIASVGQFKSLLVTSYDVTFGCSWYLCPGNRKLHAPHALPCSEMHSLTVESVSGHACLQGPGELLVSQHMVLAQSVCGDFTCNYRRGASWEFDVSITDN